MSSWHNMCLCPGSTDTTRGTFSSPSLPLSLLVRAAFSGCIYRCCFPHANSWGLRLPAPSQVIRAVACAIHRLLEHEDNIAVLADKGGTETLIGILTEVSDAVSHRAAAGALSYIARDERGRGAIIQADGLPALIGSLQKYVGDKTVLRTVCDATWRLVRLVDRHSVEEVSVTMALADLGGIPPLCEAMRRFTEEFSVQLPCCGTLNEVASLAKMHVLLLSCGAVDLLVVAQRQHLTSAELQTEAAGALRRLCHSPNGRCVWYPNPCHPGPCHPGPSPIISSVALPRLHGCITTAFGANSLSSLWCK